MLRKPLGQLRRLNSRASFVLLWLLAWLAASVLAALFSAVFQPSSHFADFLVYFTLFAFLQAQLIRRLLCVGLRHWLLLAAIGFIVGELAFQIIDAHVQYPFPPKLYSGSSIPMPEPEHIMQFKYGFYQIARDFLLWSTPLLLQWLALRGRFRQHGLWLLAAVVHAPLAFAMTEYGGICLGTLRLLGDATGFSLIRDAQPLGAIAALMDWTTPTVIMGLVLHCVLTQGENEAKRKPATSSRSWRCQW